MEKSGVNSEKLLVIGYRCNILNNNELYPLNVNIGDRTQLSNNS